METTLPSADSRPALADPARLRALRESHLLAGEPVASFERLVRLGSALAGAPVCLVSLVDDTRQVFAGAAGLTGDLAEARQTPLSHSFCQYVVGDGAPLVVEDARVHPVLQHNGGVRDHGVVAYAGFPIRDPDGHVLGTFCAADTVARTWDEAQLAALADLAATAELEVALRVRERVAHLTAQRLELVLEAASEVAVVTTDPDDRVTSLSPGARALLGLGHRTGPETGSTGASLFGRSLPLGRTDVDLPGPHGATHLSVARRHLRDPRGDSVGSVIVATDLTEARVYQGALAAALEEEVRANAVRRQLAEQQAAFIATASHELRTPVTNILGYTEVLLDDLDDDAVPDLVRTLAPVRRNAERLADLVEHVADFARLDTSRTSATMTELALADVVGSAARAVAARHPATSIEVDVPPEARVVGDRDLLGRMLVHLLDNAAKFSPPDAVVTLGAVAAATAEGVDAGWRIEVTDAGPGLAPDEAGLVTLPFFRGRAAHHAAAPGVGLGLAVVAAICELHGGTLTVTGTSGGTCASVTLGAPPPPL